MPPGVVGARAYDINDLGEIVGEMYVQVAPNTVLGHAFLFRDGQMNDLGVLPRLCLTDHLFGA
jgi:probable HAF family extracellular repeat protein